MTHRLPAGRTDGRTARLVLVTAIVGLAVVVAAPLAAGAQDAPAGTPTLAQVLDGEVAGVAAVATTTSIDEAEMGVVLEITNHSGDPVDVAIPFGTLVVTEVEGDQTLAVTPPSSPGVIDVAASGGTPTIEVDPGTSTHDLPAYCTELGDGYPGDAPVTPIAPSDVALAETLRAATVADVDHSTTQSAVWWLTDEPTAPAPDDIAPLLAVDAEAFAAAPYRVTPDTGYTPSWMREEILPEDGGSIASGPRDEEAVAILDERFDGPASPVSGRDGSGTAGGPLLWVALIGLVVVATVVIAARAGRTAPAALTALGGPQPGWYPDPWARGTHRYWDGQRWTTHTMGDPRR